AGAAGAYAIAAKLRALAGDAARVTGDGPGAGVAACLRGDAAAAPADDRAVVVVAGPAEGRDDVIAFDGGDVRRSLCDIAGRLWLAGAAVEWSGLWRRPLHRVPLPTYPFERERHWIDPAPRVRVEETEMQEEHV
ncbi:MAG TPA: hypothetical protein VHF89_10025, partial [Solirubrobacteraceae bacterium]|nr:hypothetical protein [Solirubrobacteraceae bacterium]